MTTILNTIIVIMVNALGIAIGTTLAHYIVKWLSNDK